MDCAPAIGDTRLFMSSEYQTAFANAERRQLPRVAITVPVILKRSKGTTVTGLMHNVSPGGMQVRLSTEGAAALLPKKSEIKTNAGCSVHARFLLPLRNEHVAITVKCVVAHVSPVANAPAGARVAIGFRFKRFRDATCLRRFVLFLEEQMVPPEDYELYLHGPASPRKKPKSKPITTA
ncbi:MAG: PilZ domain-containing protein [Gammaproteobacteria bacterium]|nr:PilZ domain-containing protein [Gammaproteobacteria bacterium]MDH3412911.1 PilZ domain-containing protein [Gammaproteobacteria bacterium]